MALEVLQMDTSIIEWKKCKERVMNSGELRATNMSTSLKLCADMNLPSHLYKNYVRCLSEDR